MPNFQINRDEVEKLLAVSGYARGAVFQTDAAYVLEKKGEAGLQILAKELAELDCPIDFKKIIATSWYPVGLRIISLLAIKKAFGWGDEEIEDMGNVAPKYSFIVRLLMKYFLNFPMTYKQSPTYWEKHYSLGRLEASDYSLEKRYFIIRLHNFKIHPVLCKYLGGYFKRMGQFVIKSNNFSVRETKCQFSGDPYHEYIIKW